MGDPDSEIVPIYGGVLKMAKLSTGLTSWLNESVYPQLSHQMIFGELPGFTLAQSGASWYADCPYCHRKGAFFMLPHRQAGSCKKCRRTIGWFGYLRRKLNGDPPAIASIAELAQVPAYDPEVDQWVRL